MILHEEAGEGTWPQAPRTTARKGQRKVAGGGMDRFVGIRSRCPILSPRSAAAGRASHSSDRDAKAPSGSGRERKARECGGFGAHAVQNSYTHIWISDFLF